MSTAWMPPPGRHSVQIGQSLGRALKARRGEPAHQKSSKIPDKEFYSFRYNFKPEAVDPTKVGSIETRKEGDVNKYVIEKGSERLDEGYLFTATGAEPVKEWDCILIYDEETGRYTLEKVDTYLRLNFDRKTHAPRHAPSPAASTGPGTPSTPSHIAPPPRPGPSKPFAPPRKLQNDVDLDLENELLAGLDDADGSPDEDIPLAATTKAKNAAMAAPPAKPTRPAKAKAPAKPVARKEEEEESDGEILEAVEAASKQKQKARPEPVSAPPPASKTKPAPVRRPGNNLPVRPVAAAEPSVPKPKAPPAFQAKTKVAASAGKKRPLDVEEIDFARPTQPAKRPRPSSPPPQAMPKQKERERSSFSLALPTPAPAPKQAEPPTPLSFPGSSAPVMLPGAAPSAAAPVAAVSLDSDDDWIEVKPAASAPTPAVAPPPPAPLRVIEMEEIVPTSSPRRPSPPLALPLDEDDEDDFDMEEVAVEPFQGGDTPFQGEDAEEEDDFLADVLNDVQETVGLPEPDGDAGNEGLFGEEDEFSSSEESDDD